MGLLAKDIAVRLNARIDPEKVRGIKEALRKPSEIALDLNFELTGPCRDLMNGT